MLATLSVLQLPCFSILSIRSHGAEKNSSLDLKSFISYLPNIIISVNADKLLKRLSE